MAIKYKSKSLPVELVERIKLVRDDHFKKHGIYLTEVQVITLMTAFYEKYGITQDITGVHHEHSNK